MRRALAVLLLALAPAAAGAHHPVRGVVTSHQYFLYSPRYLPLPEGAHLSFVNLDVLSHDVVSLDTDADGRPLFAASLQGAGGVADVAGVERLEPGVYPFTCSIHPWTYGELTVLDTDSTIGV